MAEIDLDFERALGVFVAEYVSRGLKVEVRLSETAPEVEVCMSTNCRWSSRPPQGDYTLTAVSRVGRSTARQWIYMLRHYAEAVLGHAKIHGANLVVREMFCDDRAPRDRPKEPND